MNRRSDRAQYAALTRVNDKPIVVFGRTASERDARRPRHSARAGVPYLQGIPDAIRALQKSVEYAAAVRRGRAALANVRAALAPGAPWTGHQGRCFQPME